MLQLQCTRARGTWRSAGVSAIAINAHCHYKLSPPSVRSPASFMVHQHQRGIFFHCHCRLPLPLVKVESEVPLCSVCVCVSGCLCLSHFKFKRGGGRERERGTSVPPNVAQCPCVSPPPSAFASASAPGLLLLRLLPVQLYSQENFISIALSKRLWRWRRMYTAIVEATGAVISRVFDTPHADALFFNQLVITITDAFQGRGQGSGAGLLLALKNCS
jgi:hypothetical protein